MKVIHSGQYYQSYDGEIFSDEEDCLHHEMLQLGLRQICPCCQGEGFTKLNTVTIPCNRCEIKGWVEVKEIWE